MRKRTVIGVAAAAVAVGAGGMAFAAAQAGPSVPAVADVSPATPRNDGGAASSNRWDCPEKDGSAGGSADPSTAGEAAGAAL